VHVTKIEKIGGVIVRSIELKSKKRVDQSKSKLLPGLFVFVKACN